MKARDIGFALVLWGMLIWRWGYAFGTGDHVELLPYVLFLHNLHLFPHDLFIQSLHAAQPNERTIVANLLLPCVNYLPITLFLLHVLSTVLIAVGLKRIAALFLNDIMSWLVVFAALVLCYGQQPGNDELYDAAMQASSLSTAFSVWALFFWIQKRWLTSSLLMIVATYMHVLAGMDVMLALIAASALQCLTTRDVKWPELVRFSLPWLVLAGPYLMAIYLAKTAGNNSVSSGTLFWIQFEFRHPHHFIFRTFPVMHKILLVVYSIPALYIFSRRNNSLFYFFCTALAALCAYIVAVDFFHVTFVANFQWYKLMPYLKFLGILAIVMMCYTPSVARKISSLNSESILNKTSIIGGLGITLFAVTLWQQNAFSRGFHIDLEDEINICERTKNCTDTSAVLVVPFQFTAMKYFGQRSCYVEFKAIAKNQRDALHWYNRIHQVYGLNYNEPQSGFSMEEKANANLNRLSTLQIDSLKTEGVTHIINTHPGLQENHQLLAKEGPYYLYKL
ncbi:MAG: DUF6798 domain-containing protein [Chitinophagales bacterium]